MRLRRVLPAVAAALALIATACERAPTSHRIVIAVSVDAGTLLPVAESSALDGEIDEMLYLSLNSARWEDGAVQYLTDDLSLARDWAFSADSTRLTYHLRPDAVWSDGEPITAADVAFTYDLIRSPEIASPYIDFWEELDSVAPVDDHTVTFYFKRRYPGMLFHSGLGIIPRHIFARSATSHETLLNDPTLVQPGRSLVVSGPYRVAEWRRGERLVLEANPRAFTGRPATDTVIFRIVPEPRTRRVELENGAVDVIHPVPLGEGDELAADPRFRVGTVDDRFYDYIAWNPARFGAFDDPEVRRALSLAIDRTTILGALNIASYAEPAAGPYPPIFRRLRDPSLTPDPYEPDSARAILARAGWRDRDGDGVLDRNGKPFRFTLLTQAGNERRTSAAEIIQAGYARIGIDMKIQAIEFNALLQRAFNERDFDAVLMGWQVGLSPDYIVGRFWPADHPYNLTGYSSVALDSAVRRAQAAPTADAAAPDWRAAARIIARDRPYAFLWYFDDLVGLSRKVQGARIDTYGVYQNLNHWRLGVR